MNRLVGGWSFDGIARLQSGTTLDFGNVRLMGMSAKELQDAFKLRFDDAGKLVYMLPQDIIDNTVGHSAPARTSATGYSDQGVPTGRYHGARQWPGLHRDRAGSNTRTVRPAMATAACAHWSSPGRCWCGSISARASASPIKGNTNVEFRAEFLNAFNTPWFEAVTGATNNTYSNPDNFRVTDADSGRTIQFVFRVNW